MQKSNRTISGDIIISRSVETSRAGNTYVSVKNKCDGCMMKSLKKTRSLINENTKAIEVIHFLGKHLTCRRGRDGNESEITLENRYQLYYTNCITRTRATMFEVAVNKFWTNSSKIDLFIFGVHVEKGKRKKKEEKKKETRKKEMRKSPIYRNLSRSASASALYL